MSCLKAPEEGPSPSLQASGGLRHLFLDSRPLHSNLCLSCHVGFSVSFSVLFSSYKDTSLWIQGPPSVPDDFSLRSLTNDICKNPISK